ncbi:MAG: GNAT family N-acetyltransferase [Thermoplasmata archaeon]
MNRHLLELHWLNNELGPGARRRDWPDATAIGSAIPNETLNILFVTATPRNPDQLIRNAREFFGPHSVWRVTAPERLAGSVGPVALDLGMQPAAPVPRMVLRPIPEPSPVPAGLEIRPVTSEAGLRDFRLAGGRGFQIPRWILRIAIPELPSSLDAHGVRLGFWVGYCQGSPVATSALLTRDGIGGVYFVGTVPEARRRGYGTALTWAAIEAARREGATVCYLQASLMGRGVYERMGFRRVDDYHDWVTASSGPAQFRALGKLLGLALRPRNRRPAPTASVSEPPPKD